MSPATAMDYAHGESNKRRIPDALRRRALVSCDRCKKRRARCLRSPGAPQDACRSCLESGSRCESTLPRKHRIYGSLEMLSLRYRALEALVKGLFPDQNTEDTDVLFRIAEAHHVPMPSNEDQSPVVDVLKQSPESSSYPLPMMPSHNQPNITSPPVSENPFTRGPSKVAEEKLIPNPDGVAHYIGPSSSFGYIMEVRKMVAERNSVQDSLRHDRRRSALQSAFASLPASKALGHQDLEKENDVPDDDDQAELVVQEPIAKKHRHKSQQQLRQQPLGGPFVEPPRKKPLLSFMPAREVADALVDAFFEKVHPNYLLFHRGAFQVRYERLWDHNMSQKSEPDVGWICCVFMVFVFGAQALEQHDSDQTSHLQRRYFALVQSRLHQLINTTTLTNIQAILLLQLYQHNSCQRNASWMLLGCASRMAIALGMHRDGAIGEFDPIERQVRRRVWWTLYQFEQNLCMILGRPSAIEDIEVNISLPNENLLDCGDCIQPGYLDHSVRLTKIACEIKRKIYAAPSSRSEQEELPKASLARSLLQMLDTWRRDLPPHLQLECTSLLPKQRRAVLLLHIHYHHIASLLTRPYLLRKVTLKLTRQLGRQPHFPDLEDDEFALSHSCGNSAREAMIDFRELSRSGMLDGVAWQDFYYAYHGVLVLSLDFLERSGEEDSNEDLARKATVREVLNIVRNTKLCRTFHVLVHVAAQFAKVVDISDETGGDSRPGETQTGQPSGPVQEAVRSVSRLQLDGNSGNAGVVNDCFLQGTMDLPWDFLDVSGYTFGEALARVVDEDLTISGFDQFMGPTYLPIQ